MSTPSLCPMRANCRFLVSLLVALMLCACSGSDSAPLVPKRPAYPRPELYPAEYAQPDFPVRFAVNAAARASTQSTGSAHWLTVDYPRYSATLYVTATPVEGPGALRAEVDNRLRRMELNAGSTPVDERAGTAGASRWTLTRARGASATPLQFILYPSQERGWVVSGAVFLKGNIAPVDSLAPIINALTADLEYALNHYSEH